jgi:hypothetical protein
VLDRDPNQADHQQWLEPGIWCQIHSEAVSVTEQTGITTRDLAYAQTGFSVVLSEPNNVFAHKRHVLDFNEKLRDLLDRICATLVDKFSIGDPVVCVLLAIASSSPGAFTHMTNKSSTLFFSSFIRRIWHRRYACFFPSTNASTSRTKQSLGPDRSPSSSSTSPAAAKSFAKQVSTAYKSNEDLTLEPGTQKAVQFNSSESLT